MDKLIEFSLDEILEGDPLGLLNEPKVRTKSLNEDDSFDIMVDDIEAKLQNSLDREVSSTLIGEYAMEARKEVDEVAYVRFASVYQDFQDVEAFRRQIEQMQLREQ